MHIITLLSNILIGIAHQEGITSGYVLGELFFLCIKSFLRSKVKLTVFACKKKMLIVPLLSLKAVLFMG